MDNPAPDYRDVLGLVDGLRRGFTSGTSTQAAALAAAILLVTGRVPDHVDVTLRDGRKIRIPVVNPRTDGDSASCGIIKDAGDDNDITNGAEFRAEVRFSQAEGVRIDGGDGVGRVIKEGLPIPPGKAAINPNPRRMIIQELTPLLSRPEAAERGRGFDVVISVPRGAELAKQTWNPRLGITGGVSIIGTTGVVEPKSSAAYRASIALALKVLKTSGWDTAALAFGYVGETWYGRCRGWESDRVVKIGDHLGFALDTAAGRGFGRIVVAGHVGKMTKVAAGLFDTHWSSGDARLETVAAWAAAAGADNATSQAILELTTAEAAVELLREKKLEEAWTLMNRRLLERCRLRFEKEGKKTPSMESILLSLKGEELARNEI